MIKKIKHHIGNFMPALRSFNYRLYFIGQGISLVGTWFASIAKQWLIYPILTKNQSLLGVISMVNTIPTVLLVLFAGVIVDRVNKRQAVIFLQALFAIIEFIMAILIFTGRIQVWHVVLASFITGVLFALDMPARNSLVLDSVDRKTYPSVLSLNNGIFNTARAIGPALAGFAIATIGIAPAFFIDAISFIAVIVCLFWMLIPNRVKDHHVSFMEGFKEGLFLILKDKLLVILLPLVTIFNFLTWPRYTLLPVFANDIFKTREWGFGLLQSSLGIGAVIGAIGFYKLYEKTEKKIHLITVSLFLLIGTQIWFALTKSFLLALILQVVAGWGGSTLTAVINTLVQFRAPNKLRGRIFSFYSFALFLGMPFGGLITSLGVATIGARTTVLTSGIAYAVIMIIFFGFLSRKITAEINNIK